MIVHSVCAGVCVCLLVRNLGEYFVSLLVEPIAGKNVSPSDKKLWRFLKNILVAEKSSCKALLIGRHLEISSLLLMSALSRKHRNANFCIFEALSIVITSCSSAICGVLSINS